MQPSSRGVRTALAVSTRRSQMPHACTRSIDDRHVTCDGDAGRRLRSRSARWTNTMLSWSRSGASRHANSRPGLPPQRSPAVPSLLCCAGRAMHGAPPPPPFAPAASWPRRLGCEEGAEAHAKGNSVEKALAEGTVEQWNSGTMEQWNSGTVEQWNSSGSSSGGSSRGAGPGLRQGPGARQQE